MNHKLKNRQVVLSTIHPSVLKHYQPLLDMMFGETEPFFSQVVRKGTNRVLRTIDVLGKPATYLYMNPNNHTGFCETFIWQMPPPTVKLLGEYAPVVKELTTGTPYMDSTYCLISGPTRWYARLHLRHPKGPVLVVEIPLTEKPTIVRN